MSRERVRVLLAENTVRGLGGSYESLYVTALAIDKERFEPVALFFQPNHYAEKLEAAGVKVIVAKSRLFWEKPGYLEKSAKIRSTLPRRGWIGSARKKVVAFARALLGGVPTLWTVYRILKREKISILHTNNNIERDSMMILAGVLARTPVVAHERQLASCSWLARRVSGKVRILVCISDAVLEHTRQNGSRTKDRRRIYNALDLEAFKKVEPSLPPGVLRAGIVGRIMRKKGQRFFIEAAAIVQRKFPAADLYVLGQSTGDDRAYEEEARALSKSLGLEDRVHWMGHLADPLPLVASLDVVVHAAIEPEPFGRVIIEALALGRPVVATALGGPLEILEDNESGFLIAPGKAEEIAEKVSLLFEDPSLARRISAGALRRAEDFGAPAYARQIEQVYSDALSGPSVPVAAR